MEEKTFTNRDHLLGVCDIFEIGKQWEDRYSKTDVFEGRCISAHIGIARASVVDPMAHPDTLLKPVPESTTPAPLGADDLMSDDIFETEMAAYRSDPARYRTSNASNLNKLLDVAARRQEKREESPTLELDKLSAADLAKMSLINLKRILIEVVMQHVPVDRQDAALRMLRR